MRISKTIEFDAGHRVPDHESKCSSPHGHRYKVEVVVEGDVQPVDGRSEGGMVMDFGAIKQALMLRVHDVLDHAFMAYDQDVELIEFYQARGWKIVVLGYVPTAENLCNDIAHTLMDALDPLRVSTVTVWETPTSYARWESPLDYRT